MILPVHPHIDIGLMSNMLVPTGQNPIDFNFKSSFPYLSYSEFDVLLLNL